MIEIERKFLVKSGLFQKQATRKRLMLQGFLCTDPERTVRVRVTGNEAFITIKGISDAAGLSRFEWEHGISVQEGQALLELCKKPLIEKYRYDVPVGSHIFEVDEFLGANLGLVLAEVELSHENEPLIKPGWLGDEVTGLTEYYNSQLSLKPYTTWKH